MRYVSDYLSGRDLSGYDQVTYGRIIDLNESEQKALKEQFKDPVNFEEKYGVKRDGSDTFPISNQLVVRQNRLQMLMTKFAEHMASYLVSMNMEHIELRFGRKDIDEIRSELVNGLAADHKLANHRLSTYECLAAYLSPLIGKYKSWTGKLKRIMVPVNARNRTTKLNDYSIGNCVFGIDVRLQDEKESLEYNASNFAFKLQEVLRRYGRVPKENETIDQLSELLTDHFCVSALHGHRYSLYFGPLMEEIRGNALCWNEFRGLKLYEYQFGVEQRPLLYMYGMSHTGNMYMILDAPDDPDGVRVLIRLQKPKAKKLREAESECLQRYEVVAEDKSF